MLSAFQRLNLLSAKSRHKTTEFKKPLASGQKQDPLIMKLIPSLATFLVQKNISPPKLSAIEMSNTHDELRQAIGELFPLSKKFSIPVSIVLIALASELPSDSETLQTALLNAHERIVTINFIPEEKLSVLLSSEKTLLIKSITYLESLYKVKMEDALLKKSSSTSLFIESKTEKFSLDLPTKDIKLTRSISGF